MKTVKKVKLFYDGDDTMENDVNEFLSTLIGDVRDIQFRIGGRGQYNAIMIYYTITTD